MIKICSTCKLDLSVKKFRKRFRKLKDGTIKEYYYSVCKKCEGKLINVWQKNKYKERKEKNIESHIDFLKKHQLKNRNSRNKGINILSEKYLAQVLNMKTKEIKKFPQLIEAKRAQLTLYRKVNPNHEHN